MRIGRIAQTSPSPRISTLCGRLGLRIKILSSSCAVIWRVARLRPHERRTQSGTHQSSRRRCLPLEIWQIAKSWRTLERTIQSWTRGPKSLDQVQSSQRKKGMTTRLLIFQAVNSEYSGSDDEAISKQKERYRRIKLSDRRRGRLYALLIGIRPYRDWLQLRVDFDVNRGRASYISAYEEHAKDKAHFDEHNSCCSRHAVIVQYGFKMVNLCVSAPEAPQSIDTMSKTDSTISPNKLQAPVPVLPTPRRPLQNSCSTTHLYDFTSSKVCRC